MPNPRVKPKKEIAIAVLSHIVQNPGQLTTRVEWELSDDLNQHQIRETMVWLLENRYVEKRKPRSGGGWAWHALVSIRKMQSLI